MVKMFHRKLYLRRFLEVFFLFQLIIPLSNFSCLAQESYVTIDLKKVESFIVSLQKKDGYFFLYPGSKAGGPWETLLALETLSTIGTNLEKAIDTNTLWRNLEWHWGYMINGTWYPGAGIQAENIISYFLLGMRPPITEKDYFVNLAKESQNSDGGIGLYKGGDSSLETTYLTVRALKMLNSLNAVDEEAIFNYVRSKLMNYSGLWIKDVYYAIATLDLLNRRGENGIGTSKETEIYNWLENKLGGYSTLRFDYRSLLYVLATMKILKGTARCDEAKVLYFLRRRYDPNTGGFGWPYGNGTFYVDVFETWYAIKLLELLPNVRIDNYKVKFYVNVTSPYSVISGSGWYEEGSAVKLKLRETSLGFLVQKFFDHFEGLSSKDKVVGNGEVEVFVDSPRTIKAVWRTDYTQLFILIFIVAVTLLLATRKRKRLQGKLKRELAKYESYLSRLEEEKKKGTISERAYEILKKEYEKNIERIKKEIEKSESDTKP
ncbi:MAG: prenyltransferase/squalene oxidase repeat-containing protein [Thermoproteota archaeon]